MDSLLWLIAASMGRVKKSMMGYEQGSAQLSL